jgi:predicted glycosyltransferase
MPGGEVWFDFENTPHVLFLEPLLRRLSERGIRTVVTAKPQAQTLELARLRGLEAIALGSGDFRGLIRKVLGTGGRARQLWRWARPRNPALLVSCSRSASLAARLLKLPAIGMLDYEHAEVRLLSLGCDAIWMPDLLQNAELPPALRAVARFYPGLKENLYLDGMRFDRGAERARLGVNEGERFVVARPPAESAHYASERSLALWQEAVDLVQPRPGVRILVLPRSREQAESLRNRFAGRPNVTVQREVVAGPELVNAADLVLSGGGTMNREAAVLGVPAWSTFAGPEPHIDRCLAGEQRLRLIHSSDELRAAVAAFPEPRAAPRGPYPDGLAVLTSAIEAQLHAG